MDNYLVLLAYFDKQIGVIDKVCVELTNVDVTVYDKRFLFAMRMQQFYTALEDLFKHIAKDFENHIKDLANFHKELLSRMTLEIPKVRPAILSQESFLFLDKVRSFRHFIRHAYDCELNVKELKFLQDKLIQEYPRLKKDLNAFHAYLKKLSEL